MKKMEAPGFWDDQGAAQAVVAKLSALKASVDPVEQLTRELDDLGELCGMAEADDAETWAQIRIDLDDAAKRFEALEVQRLYAGEDDRRDAILTVHAGTGGVDAHDWASMLLRMYTMWAEARGYAVTLTDRLDHVEAGIKHATLEIRGPFAYGNLVSEIGVHRLVRISPFDAAARRHTAFASVDVMPDYPEEEITIDEKDLKIDTYRAGGAGGQHVNTTDSAVRITHEPTGVVVQCQNERSQHRNRTMAMKMLMARLQRLKEAERSKALGAIYGDKGEIAWGNQIRSYTLQPFTLVKDHRTDVQTSNTAKVLDGDIDLFIEPYLQWRADQQAAGK
jgi:peptide chain release factor 2